MSRCYFIWSYDKYRRHGFKYVKRATEQFDKTDRDKFTSDIIGIDVPLWDEKNSLVTP